MLPHPVHPTSDARIRGQFSLDSKDYQFSNSDWPGDRCICYESSNVANQVDNSQFLPNVVPLVNRNYTQL